MTSRLLSANTPIVRLQQVQKAVQEEIGMRTSLSLVSKVLRKEMRMGYRKSNVVPIQSNLPRCLVLRQ